MKQLYKILFFFTFIIFILSLVFFLKTNRMTISNSQYLCEKDASSNEVYKMVYLIEPWIKEITNNILEIGINAGASSTLNSQYLLKKNVNGYEVILYDKKNNEVRKIVYPIEPWIKEVTNNILEIGVSTGAPSTYVFYYNKDTAKMSDTYFNSILFGNKYIAYMESTEKIILSDIFDEGILYKEVEENFTKCLNPIINIEVLDNDNILLEYYAGENFEEKSELILISD